MVQLDVHLAALSESGQHRFSDWPLRHVPPVAAGVYTIWDGTALIYVGMAGRSLTPETIATYSTAGKSTGLYSRLNSHAGGRRSGDQFCVYVADRLVLPALSPEQISEIASGALSFDTLVRAYVRERLSYRYIEVPDGTTARAVESAARGGALGQPPALNPLPTPR